MMKALVVKGPGRAELEDVPIPKLDSDEALVKVEYAASNPTDYKHLDSMSPPGVQLGCDFSGHVSAFSSEGGPLALGERVAGVVHGGKFKSLGSYAEYVKVKKDMIFELPKEIKMNEGATFGVAYITAGQCLFSHHKNAYPPTRTDGWFLVQGGSTSVGLFVIQLARLIGYQVVATCSPRSFDLVKSYGAHHVVDYHDIGAAEEIKKLSGGISGAIECAGGMKNLSLVVNSFGTKGGLVTSLAAVPEEASQFRQDVRIERILMYTVFGYTFEFLPGSELAAKPEDHRWFLDFVLRSKELMQQVKGTPVDERQGLEAVMPGLAELKAGKLSGKKLVYKV